MTEQETIKVITIIVMSYPAHDKFKDESTVKGMVQVWKAMFKNDDVKLVEAAVQKHIATNKWPPSIAEIRENMFEIKHPEILPPDVAWSAVSDILATYDEYQEPDLKSLLPEMAVRVIDTIGWSKLCSLYRGHYIGNADGMDRVAFMDLYKPAYEREKSRAMLPDYLRNKFDKQQRIAGAETQKMLDTARAIRKKNEILLGGDYEALSLTEGQ